MKKVDDSGRSGRDLRTEWTGEDAMDALQWRWHRRGHWFESSTAHPSIPYVSSKIGPGEGIPGSILCLHKMTALGPLVRVRYLYPYISPNSESEVSPPRLSFYPWSPLRASIIARGLCRGRVKTGSADDPSRRATRRSLDLIVRIAGHVCDSRKATRRHASARPASWRTPALVRSSAQTVVPV